MKGFQTFTFCMELKILLAKIGIYTCFHLIVNLKSTPLNYYIFKSLKWYIIIVKMFNLKAKLWQKLSSEMQAVAFSKSTCNWNLNDQNIDFSYQCRYYKYSSYINDHYTSISLENNFMFNISINYSYFQNIMSYFLKLWTLLHKVQCLKIVLID